MAGGAREVYGAGCEGNDWEIDKLGVGLFLHFLHDEYESKFRKMLTMEQFSNSELALLYSKQYFDSPLLYQTGLFEMITGVGKLKAENTSIMALHFYAPIYTLLTLCDRQPEREEEALELLEQHIKQFNRMYAKEK